MSQAFYTDAQQGRILRVLPDLIGARQLLLDLVWKDIRVRYRYATMGFLWAVLEPLIMMAVLTLVFSQFLRMGEIEELGVTAPRHYAAFVLSGLIPWQFFSAGLAASTRSLIENRDLVKKAHFPREVIPFSAIGVALVNFLIGTIFLLGIFTVLMGRFPASGLVWVPLIFAIQFALLMGLGLLLSSVNAYFRDVAYMVDAALLFGFYATPILYWHSMIEGRLAPWAYSLYMFNPMAGIVTAYRLCLFGAEGQSVAPTLVGPAIVAALAVVAGVVVFRKNTPVLADNL
jgi:ABC-type polysaccharide/polyol phosphate export permease